MSVFQENFCESELHEMKYVNEQKTKSQFNEIEGIL